MSFEKLRELKQISMDPQVPMSNRMQAAAKYDELLTDIASKVDLEKFKEQIKSTTSNESANIS